MKAMQVVGILLILNGAGTCVFMILMAIGGLEVLVSLALPIGLYFTPVRQAMMAWVEIPLAMNLNAELLEVRSTGLSGFLGSGEIDFRVKIAGGGYDSAPVPVVPALWVEEDAEIDEITRYVISGGPFNYPSIFFWLVALGSLGALFLSIIFKFVTRSQNALSEENENATEVAIPPPPKPVQVIGVQSTEETVFDKE